MPIGANCETANVKENADGAPEEASPSISERPTSRHLGYDLRD